ncbi:MULTISPECIES: SorT family sulfite dehydrogenase catalytic subunit [unclassified Sulfitobacter]|jgi:DMSO/TMAO reductase YedYZ molybdopterin-dependent catalytic subunit|uniref:SorT family sulfite dehydrogenase catalytic subunit n=4 Tax=Sulfitobacter TaxID=60136 RepID=UPI0007C3F3B2|nr:MULTISPECIES: molybdopterin-dependent oxidoreductase [unclassified Sulfitobacter]KZY04988.1 sulfite oxidase [Sulfitobacter sp. HI0023]KZY23533.1 sulfite oxidase [Sulfitobacter sp. HI0040]
MKMIENVKRRHFLIGSAGTMAAAAVGMPAGAQDSDNPLPDYVSWKDAEDVIVHSKQTLETKRAAQGSELITPSTELYIRNNLPAPSDDIVANRDAWEIEIDGVANPGTMTVGDMKTLAVETVVCVLQCSGNGRAFFDHETSGTQWSVGAAGNVVWTGVPVRAVIDAMGGAAEGANFLTGTGGEEIPEGVPKETIQVERSVPMAAMDHAILAWEMNGEPLPLAHGGPLRLVIPGYYGVNNVKYLKRLALTEGESPNKIQQTSYRVRPVGVKGDPSQPSMYEMSVKSWITGPLMDAATGKVQIHGVAMGGVSDLEKVEVSIDGGQSWAEAQFLGPDLGPYAWRPFVMITDLAEGTHTLASRATAKDGLSQPETFPPNERGYGNNGWRVHAVDVTVS